MTHRQVQMQARREVRRLRSFATQQKKGKDNSGDKIYVSQEDGTIVLDSHGHLVVDQDLYNHEGITGDGIAEAFAEFAKKDGLSFFR